MYVLNEFIISINLLLRLPITVFGILKMKKYANFKHLLIIIKIFIIFFAYNYNVVYLMENNYTSHDINNYTLLT